MERSAYQKMAEVETRHWWFSARRDIISTFLRNYFPKGKLNILDAGSGTGENLKMLSDFGKVSALEMDTDAAAYSRSVCPEADVKVGKLPADRSFFLDRDFDLVTMFDVLEHIEDDLAALISVKGLLKPGGILFITVPAFQWLFGPHDTELHHFRRYSLGELRDKVVKVGFKVERITYFNSLLFPAVVASRLADLVLNRRRAYGMNIPGQALNTMLYRIFRFERFILRGFSLPFGSSLLAIMRREKE